MLLESCSNLTDANLSCIQCLSLNRKHLTKESCSLKLRIRLLAKPMAIQPLLILCPKYYRFSIWLPSDSPAIKYLQCFSMTTSGLTIFCLLISSISFNGFVGKELSIYVQHLFTKDIWERLLKSIYTDFEKMHDIRLSVFYHMPLCECKNQ